MKLITRTYRVRLDQDPKIKKQAKKEGISESEIIRQGIDLRCK